MEKVVDENLIDTGERTGKSGNGGRGNNLRDRIFHALSRFGCRNWSWLLASLIVVIFFVLVAIVAGVAPFGKNSFSAIDSMHQYVPFFSDFQRKVWDGEGLFYTWNVAMGQNFLSLLLYYIASPLNLILLIFPRSGIFSAFTLILIIKMAFIAGSFGYWLSRRRGGHSNSFMITGFSIAFALCNYMIGYNWNIMWLDCIMVLPLAILGLERIFRDESPKMYILSLAYILYCNYYIAFIICIFLVLWFFAHRQGSVRDFFRHGFTFAGCSILSAGLSAFALLTAYTGIMQTSSAGAEIPKQSWLTGFFDLLKQHFYLTEPIDTQSFDGGLNAYCGVFAILLFFFFLLQDRIPVAERIRKLLLIVFLVVSFNSTLLNFIWHGFHDQYGIPNRFSFVYVFTLLTIGYEAFIRLKQTDTWRLVFAMILSVAFYVICWIKGEPKGQLSGTWMFALTMVFLVAYFVIMLLRQRCLMKTFTSGFVIFWIIFGEILSNGIVGYVAIDVANGDYYGKYTDSMKEAVEYVNEKDKQEGDLFSRSDQAMPRMLDEATYNGMRCMGTFCSTVNGNLVSTMGRLGCYEGANEFLFYGGNPVLNTLTDMKYIFVRNDDYAGIESRENPVFENKDVKVYENPYVLPIAYMTGEDILSWDPDSSTRALGIMQFAEALSGEKNMYVLHTPELTSSGVQCETWVTENRPHVVNFDAEDEHNAMKVTATFTADTSGIHVMETRQSGVKKIVYKKNGEKMGHDRYQSQLFDLGYLNEGDKVELTFEFNADASDSGTISIFDYSLNYEAFLRMYEKLSSGGMKVTYVKDGKLDGTVTAAEDGVLFTTIPYDKGWSVTVDGDSAEVLAAGETFLALRLSKGTHEIKMRYISPGFLPGLAISLVCWTFFFFLCYIWRVRRKKREAASLIAAEAMSRMTVETRNSLAESIEGSDDLSEGGSYPADAQDDQGENDDHGESDDEDEAGNQDESGDEDEAGNDDETDDDETDDDETGDDETGDDETGDDKTGDDKTDYDETGDQ